MWLMTTDGFYSTTVSDTDPNDVVVRARHRDDLATLNTHLSRLHHKPGTLLAYAHSDYPWRIVIPKQAWADYLTDATERITYRNFKSEVTKVQGNARHDIYSRIWTVLLAIEKLPRAKRDFARIVKRTPVRPSRRTTWTGGTYTYEDLLRQQHDDDLDAALEARNLMLEGECRECGEWRIVQTGTRCHYCGHADTADDARDARIDAGVLDDDDDAVSELDPFYVGPTR